MEELERYVLTNESTLLGVAITIGVLFLGLLAFDFVQRVRKESRSRGRPGAWRRVVRRPFRRLAEARAALKELRRQRAERRNWDDPSRRRRRRSK